jgi:hypothetical protein
MSLHLFFIVCFDYFSAPFTFNRRKKRRKKKRKKKKRRRKKLSTRAPKRKNIHVTERIPCRGRWRRYRLRKKEPI